MRLKYPVILYRSLEDDGYIAIAFDLRGCSAYGETPELALGNVCTAIDLWLETAQKEGRKIPAPEKSIKGIKASGTKKKAIKPRGKNLRKPLVIDFDGIKTK